MPQIGKYAFPFTKRNTTCHKDCELCRVIYSWFSETENYLFLSHMLLIYVINILIFLKRHSSDSNLFSTIISPSNCCSFNYSMLFYFKSQVTCPWGELLQLSGCLQTLDWMSEAVVLKLVFTSKLSRRFKNIPIPIFPPQRLQVHLSQCDLSLKFFNISWDDSNVQPSLETTGLQEYW